MENRFLRLIEILTRHDVRFIVVGGVAAVLQRVPGSAVTNADQPAAEAKASATADADDPDKHAIIRQIRATLISDPKFAEELIREDQKRFPDGPDADERDASLISSLFNQRHMYEAQLAAINYFERHPDGEFADYVTRETRIPPPPRRGKP